MMLFSTKIFVLILFLMLFECCQNLNKNHKILCWVPTDPERHQNAVHVKNTWGKRCDYLLFFSSKYDETLPTIELGVHSGYKNLRKKVQKALVYIYSMYLHRAGWFLKADDDTYVIVENLRYFLKGYKSSEPWFFGKRFKTDLPSKGFMNGGAGYVLSRGALKRFGMLGFTTNGHCRNKPMMREDRWLGFCMENIGVTFGNTTDDCCKDRFFPLGIDQHAQPFNDGRDLWMWDKVYYVTLQGMIGCSDKPISFHKVTPGYMYVLEYLLYYIDKPA